MPPFDPRKIKDKIIEVVHGFDLGRTVICDDETGEDYTICFQNENLYVYKGPEPTEENVLITAPELISVFCRLDKNGDPYYLPVDNSTTEVGMSVDVIVSPADKKWWAEDKRAYRCWVKRCGMPDITVHRSTTTARTLSKITK